MIDHIHLVLVPLVLGRGERLWDGLEGLEERFDIETTPSPAALSTWSSTAAWPGRPTRERLPCSDVPRDVLGVRPDADIRVVTFLGDDARPLPSFILRTGGSGAAKPTVSPGRLWCRVSGCVGSTVIVSFCGLAPSGPVPRYWPASRLLRGNVESRSCHATGFV